MAKTATQRGGGRVRLGAISYMPGSMFDLVMASVFINVLSLALPLALLQVYDRIIPNQSKSTLVLLIAGVGTALVLEVLLRIGRAYVSGWMGARFEHMAGCAAMERLLNASITDFERNGTGVHLERLNALSMLKEFYSGQAILVLCDLPFAVIFLGVIAYLADELVLVPVVLIVLFAITALITGRLLRGALAARMTADDRRFNFIIEVLGGIHTVKSMAMEAQMLRRYERLQETCAGTDFDVAFRSSSAVTVGTVFSQMTLFTVVGVGATMVIDGMLTIGGLAACTMLAGRAMQPMQRAVGIWTRFQTIRLARDRLRKVFEIPLEAPPGLPKLPPVNGEVVIDNVSFRYRDDLPQILDGATMHVRAGEAVGICGGNASGKTTLLYMLMGAMRPQEGRVSIDGNDLSEYDPASLKEQIAYLPQHGVLFNGTIMENITMYRADRVQAAEEVSTLLGLDKAVAHMPQGYNTRVGQGAHDSLPRGIKQRIAVARALVDKPHILLFDEANSAMDSTGDAYMRGLLEQLKGRCSIVLVTPRPSMLRLADRIYDLQGGRLTERRPDPPVAGIESAETPA
ncbi:MAG: ATP-binding cassette domain-containing protein [Hyphomicrobiales bacterium]|nr:ATP-binding cassette domain-containing protein [Hyphomicrobiales bacterium]